MFKMFSKWFHTIGEARANRHARDVLNRMSDRELKDIGITRGDIDYIMKVKK